MSLTADPNVNHSESSLCEKHSEAAAFISQGMDPAEACRIVGLSLRYQHTIYASESIRYLPTPAEIAAVTAKIQSGEVVVSRESGRRWAEVRRIAGVMDDQML